MSDALCSLSILEAGLLLRQKNLSPVELTKAFLTRIDRLDSTLHAFIKVVPERALADARNAETEIFAGRYKGPLHGIPIGLKDVIETAGIHTTAHSRSRIHHVPTRDATVAARLAEAGPILLGKLATFELALGGPSEDLPFPLARNPWGLDRYTGGSSTGAGVAVAAGLAMAAVGTDSGGSIRNPAAFCGVVGVKPTYGRVSRTGIIPLNDSFDHVGPLAWSVRDAALVLDAIAAPDPSDPHCALEPPPACVAALDGGRDLKGLRIGAVRHFHTRDTKASDEMTVAFDAALGLMADLGAEIEPVELSPLDEWRTAFLVGLMAEMYNHFEDELRARRHEYGRIFRERIIPALCFDAADVTRAQELRRLLVAELDRIFVRYDALVCPIMLTAAPRVADIPVHSMYVGPYLAAPFNLSGHPAVAVRCGFGKEGLPLSLQIAGRRFAEPALLRLADCYERASGCANRRPPV